MLRDKYGRFVKKPEQQAVVHEVDYLAEGRNALKKSVVDRGYTGTCSYGIAFTTKYANNVGDVCHARMQWSRPLVPIGAYDFILEEDHKGEEDTLRLWFHFMANESPFKNCFLSKDADDMVENGVLYNIDEGFSRVVAAAIALRLFHEYCRVVPSNFKALYNEFRQHPGLLYALTYCADNEGKGLRTYEYGHSAFTYAFVVDSLKEYFFKNDLPPALDKPFRVCGIGYSIFDSIAETAWNQNDKTVGKLIRTVEDKAPIRAFGSKAPLEKFNMIDKFAKELMK